MSLLGNEGERNDVQQKELKYRANPNLHVRELPYSS